jgi:hypothetical protein
MEDFLKAHGDKIHGVLSCFDRMLFRGYLPIMSGWQMAQYVGAICRTAETAGATGGARQGRPRQRRIFVVASGG